MARNKVDPDDPAVAEIQSLMLSQEELAAINLTVQYDRSYAAQQLGWEITQIDELMKQPHVIIHLRRLQEGFIQEASKQRVRGQHRVGVNQAAIEARLFELANMPPEATKGTIDGQVKACLVLVDKCGYAGTADPLKGKTPEELEKIVEAGNAKIVAQKPQLRTVN